MKKYFSIVLLSFLLCGCTCEYNLKIDNNNYQEKLSIISSDSSENELFTDDLIININYDKYLISSEITEKIEDEEYYDVKRDDNSIALSYNYINSSVSKSTLALKCFDKVTIYKQSENIFITTSEKFKCFDEYDKLDSVEVVLEIDGKSISNNADKVDGNKYIWNYNRKNINKPINISATLERENTSLTSSSSGKKTQYKQNDYNIFIIILFILLIISYIVYRIIKKQGDNNNKV